MFLFDFLSGTKYTNTMQVRTYCGTCIETSIWSASAYGTVLYWKIFVTSTTVVR